MPQQHTPIVRDMKHEARLSSYSVFSSDEVGLIYNEQADVLHVLPLLPATGQNVPFVGGADDYVAFSQELQICARLPGQQHHLLVQDVLELLVPVDKHLQDKDESTYLDQILNISKASSDAFTPRLHTCSASASMGVMYTHRPSALCSSILRIANSAQMVFPLPVGAPTNTLSSLLYTALNTVGKGKIQVSQKSNLQCLCLLRDVSWMNNSYWSFCSLVQYLGSEWG